MNCGKLKTFSMTPVTWSQTTNEYETRRDICGQNYGASCACVRLVGLIVRVLIMFWQASTLVKSFEVCQLPVRCARFIVRKQWFVTGSDDMHMRVYNYNTMEKVRRRRFGSMEGVIISIQYKFKWLFEMHKSQVRTRGVNEIKSCMKWGQLSSTDVGW